jgi:hypothetical protein
MGLPLFYLRQAFQKRELKGYQPALGQKVLSVLGGGEHFWGREIREPEFPAPGNQIKKNFLDLSLK